MIDVGTIGKRACEINLNKILMEIGDEPVSSFVVKTLVTFRLGLRQLSYIPDKSWRHNMATKLHAEYVEKVKAKNLPPLVESHTLCCMKAYYRGSRKDEDIRVDTDPVGE